MNRKYFLLLFCICLFNNCFSQKKPAVTININSTFPETIYVRKVQDIIITIQNFSTNSINISNVPTLNIDYEVSIKKGNDYLPMDSNCRFLPQPIIPKEGIKNIQLKRGKKIKIPFFFPPACCFGENGDYKVRYLFGYNVRTKNYLIKTEWYKFTCMFLE